MPPIEKVRDIGHAGGAILALYFDSGVPHGYRRAGGEDMHGHRRDDPPEPPAGTLSAGRRRLAAIRFELIAASRKSREADLSTWYSDHHGCAVQRKGQVAIQPRRRGTP
jgi:hypothetical protein